MITDKIYCYYADVGCAGQTDLIEYWKERWEKEGWEPIVLGEADVEKDPRNNAMQGKIKTFPCLPGSRGFERANFERWLAFSHVDGCVADYDVFPMEPFPPIDFGGFVCGAGNGGPGFIVGTGADFSRIAEMILSYDVKPEDTWRGVPHLCDMRILHCNKHIYSRLLHNILCFGEDGWQKVPLCHFGNASLDHYTEFFRRMTKTQAVRRLIKEHYRN